MGEDITIWHNPRCSKSRGALALLAERGIQPAVVRYLDTAPERAELEDLLRRLGTDDPLAITRTGSIVSSAWPVSPARTCWLRWP